MSLDLDPRGGIFNLVPLDFVYLLVPAVVQAILYGVYATLFCQCMYIFRKRKLGGHKVILTGTILLFFFCSVQCVGGSVPVTSFDLSIVNNLLYVFTNLIADSVFAYHCYIIWGRKKYILVVPLLLILGSTGVGLHDAVADANLLGEDAGFSIGSDPRIPLFISLATNVILTFLSTGRIWWIYQELRILGPKVSRKYNTVIVLIVESGAMYCVAIAVYLIAVPTHEEFTTAYYLTSDIVVQTFFGILTQIVGIAPTLIVVRIGLGISVEDAQTAILASGIRFGHGEGRTEINQATMTQTHSNSERQTLTVDSSV